MKKLFMTGLYVLISGFFRGTGSGTSESLTKLKLATLYLHAVKTSRLLFMSLLGSAVCLVLLLVGLFLVHYVIFFYVSWDVSVKIAVTLIFAGLYIVIAVGVFVYFFAKDKWMKMFNTEAMIKELTGESSKTQDAEKRS